jgi:hypothetical protein
VVTTHRTIEDTALFPHLRSRDSGLAPPDRIDELREVTDLLTDTMRSHLSYEERELLEPLARHSFYRRGRGTLGSG